MQSNVLFVLVICVLMGTNLLLAAMLWMERKDNRKEQRHLVSQLMQLMELEEMPEPDEQAAKLLKEVTNHRSTRSTGSSVNFNMPLTTNPPKRIAPLGSD